MAAIWPLRFLSFSLRVGLSVGHVTHRLRCTIYNNMAGLSANQCAAFSEWSVGHVTHNL